MPNTIDFSFADVVLVSFPFTDQTTTKKRPAVIVSSDVYHRSRRDVIVMAVTSRVGSAEGAPGEVLVQHWTEAGLLKPSLIKPVVATLERSLVLKKLGSLHQTDVSALRKALGQVFG